jgi:hypothetical protein
VSARPQWFTRHDPPSSAKQKAGANDFASLRSLAPALKALAQFDIDSALPLAAAAEGRDPVGGGVGWDFHHLFVHPTARADQKAIPHCQHFTMFCSFSQLFLPLFPKNNIVIKAEKNILKSK